VEDLRHHADLAACPAIGLPTFRLDPSELLGVLLGPAGESIPVREGELCLGQWQRVLFLELDRERDRRWLVQVVGV
jgi:hypothetical protein